MPYWCQASVQNLDLNSSFLVLESRNYAFRRIALVLDFWLGYSTHIEMQNEVQIDNVGSEKYLDFASFFKTYFGELS